MTHRLRAISAVLAALWLAAPALAQDKYPSRPIRMIVPYPPGGSTDPTGRAFAAWLSEALGQQVVVDNRPGAGATIGHGLGAKATPDGYTILLGTSGGLAVEPRARHEAVVRPGQGLRADRPWRLRAVPAGGVSRAAGREPEGIHRALEGAAHPHQLRVAGSRHAQPSRRRAAEGDGRIPVRARAVQGRRSGDRGHDRRPRAGDLRRHTVRRAARENRAAEGHRDRPPGPRGDLARYSGDRGNAARIHQHHLVRVARARWARRSRRSTASTRK